MLSTFWRSFLITAFLVTTQVHPIAAAEVKLPLPGVRVDLSASYIPILIKGLKIHPQNPLLLDFILDAGDSNHSLQKSPALQSESEKLIKYFLAGITIPENDVWVNLSPYEKSRIAPEALSQTEMGRDMLAQDYLLKQITASLIYPEDQIGKEFWERIYAQAQKLYGTTQIPTNTFNKVWVMPDEAQVYEHGHTVYVIKAHLKVMLEEDYLALNQNDKKRSKGISSEISTLSSQILRELIIPALEKEVNEGKNFAPLRQIYHSLILATWYKTTIKNALLNQAFANQNKISGVSTDDPTAQTHIYEQYLQAYKKGVFNYIKEDIDRVSKEPIPRKYFSGGFRLNPTIKKVMRSVALASLLSFGNYFQVQSLQQSVPSVNASVDKALLTFKRGRTNEGIFIEEYTQASEVYARAGWKMYHRIEANNFLGERTNVILSTGNDAEGVYKAFIDILNTKKNKAWT